MSLATIQSLREIHPREIKGMVREIPTLPAIYQQLFAMMQDPDVSVIDVAEVIAQDQALTAKVLHLVNSAFFGQKKQVNTISRAVVILGFKSVKDAALATAVFDFFAGKDAAEEASLARFWKHSIAVGCISKVLSRTVNLQDAEEGFVVGLLHDIGKLVMKKYFAHDFEELGHHLNANQLNWHVGERQLFKVDHAIIGKTLFRAWKFPPPIVEAVQFHHHPESATSNLQMASLVHVANHVAYLLDHGSPLSHVPQPCSKGALDILGTTLEEILEHEETLRQEIARSMSILKLTS